jgi:hypothetical protein
VFFDISHSIFYMKEDIVKEGHVAHMGPGGGVYMASLKKGDQIQDLGVDRKNILRWILSNYNTSVQNGCTPVTQYGPTTVRCESCKENSRSILSRNLWTEELQNIFY